MDFYNDRRPKVADDYEWDLLHDPEMGALDHNGVKAANARLRGAAPAYELGDLNRRIRTTAVQRHRTRQRGGEDFTTMGEYLNFMTGRDDGGT